MPQAERPSSLRASPRLLSAVLATILLTVALAVGTYLDPLKEGLTASYFRTLDGTSRLVRSLVEPSPSTRSLASAWHDAPPERFVAAWRGGLLVPKAGTYTFATASDDGSHLYVDGQLVVDNGGRHSVETRSGSIGLARGVHSIFIDYAQEGGGFAFELLWGTSQSDLQPIPSWALASRQVGLARFLARLVLSRSLMVVLWLWLGTLLFVGGRVVSRRWPLGLPAIRRDAGWPALRWLLLGSLVLNLAGIWWGLPGTWVAIELSPQSVLEAVSQRFSHGWFDAYPPLHFVVLAIAMSPMLALQALGGVDLDGSAGTTILVVICRLVSVGMGVGILLAIYWCGLQVFGRRAGLFAVANFALVAPFLYYAKTANVDVPYIFWWALSLVFYLRVLERFRLRDYVLFAAAATCSVCTKDQAYGLYLLLPLVIVFEKWQANRKSGLARPLWRAVFDRHLAAAGLTAAVLFAACHNMLFNFGGFVDHVRFLVGPGSVTYRAFDPTLAGRMRLLGRTAYLVEESFGWPLLLASIAGVFIAAATPRVRRRAVWLVLSPISYYLGFINVVLYNYDRFVLPLCLILTLFGGFAFDRLLASSVRLRVAGLVVTGVTFAYTILYAGTVDVLMIGDSRYAVQRWLAERVRRDALIGHAFNLEYLPYFDDRRHVDVATVEDLRSEQPAYYVLNVDYARAVPPETPTGLLLTGLHDGSLGYRLVYRFRRDTPWPWLPDGHPDLVGQRLEGQVISILRNINPTIEVFQRDAVGVR